MDECETQEITTEFLWLLGEAVRSPVLSFQPMAMQGMPLTNPWTPWNSWAGGDKFQGAFPFNMPKEQVIMGHA